MLEALRSVGDPEYPDVSIVDLGLVETVEVDDDAVRIGLIPTFSGCPALAMIADDVRAAIESVPGVRSVAVDWLAAPVWSTSRMSSAARRALAEEYTVVLRGSDGSLRCPVCGSHDVREQSMAGPTRCRSISWCDDCRNPVEVMR
ncbi:MAG: 1,2-phenylacetyl-CoA epoxidase subunit PaaD [Actinomycetota bacterium]